MSTLQNWYRTPIQNQPIPRTMCIANAANRATRRSCTHWHIQDAIPSQHTRIGCAIVQMSRHSMVARSPAANGHQPTTANQRQATNGIHNTYKLQMQTDTQITNCKYRHRSHNVKTNRRYKLWIKTQLTNCKCRYNLQPVNTKTNHGYTYKLQFVDTDTVYKLDLNIQ